jgi:hypothetical protein
MRRFLPFFLLPFALAVIGPCTTASRADQRTSLRELPLDPPIEGVLTTEGQQCPAMRAKDGHLYTLTGDLHGFKPHDQVCVVPNYTDMTYCMQGTTAHVDRIGHGSCPGG